MVTAAECDFNLLKPGCLEFCSNPDNRCSDDSNVQYCVGKYGQNKVDYPDLSDDENVPAECKCLLMGPSTRLERKLELANHGNRACWSPYCRIGTSPKLDQLSKPSWWIDMQRCAAINFCIVDMDDTNLNQYGNSILQINNCNDEQKQKSAGQEDFQSTEESVVDVPSTNSKSSELSDDMKLIIGVGIFLVILLVSSISSKAKKLEKNLTNLKKSIGF